MERSHSPPRVPGTARAGSEQECSAEGPTGPPGMVPGPPVTHGSSSQSNRSVCPSPALGTPRELQSLPSHALMPPSWGTAALKHSIQEPAGQGQSPGLPPVPAAALLLSDFLKGAKAETPSQGWAPCSTLQRAVIALCSPGRKGRAGAELLGLSPPQGSPQGSPHLAGPGAQGRASRASPGTRGTWGCLF